MAHESLAEVNRKRLKIERQTAKNKRRGDLNIFKRKIPLKEKISRLKDFEKATGRGEGQGERPNRVPVTKGKALDQFKVK